MEESTVPEQSPFVVEYPHSDVMLASQFHVTNSDNIPGSSPFRFVEVPRGFDPPTVDRDCLQNILRYLMASGDYVAGPTPLPLAHGVVGNTVVEEWQQRPLPYSPLQREAGTLALLDQVTLGQIPPIFGDRDWMFTSFGVPVLPGVMFGQFTEEGFLFLESLGQPSVVCNAIWDI